MHRARGGYLLVESLVALSVLTVGFLGIVSLLSRSLSLNRTVSDTHIATYLAAEGIEVLKNMIDANILQGLPWTNGITSGDHEVVYNSTALEPYQARLLGFDPGTNLYIYGGSEPTRFTRRVRITFVGSEEVVVESRVNWTAAGGGSFSARLEDHFLKWRQQ